jgi:hypothetical protein
MYTKKDIWNIIELNNNDVLEFINKNKNNVDIDFLLGFAFHILMDIYNNIKLWTPFRIKNTGKDFKELHKIVYEENMYADSKLFEMCDFKDEIWGYLKASKGIDLLNIVNIDDMEKIKNSILNAQYDNTALIISDEKGKQIIKDKFEFIEGATQYIKEIYIQEIKKL